MDATQLYGDDRIVTTWECTETQDSMASRRTCVSKSSFTLYKSHNVIQRPLPPVLCCFNYAVACVADEAIHQGLYDDVLILIHVKDWTAVERA